ncbi:hypothetical protein BBM40_17875 [Vibrio parahaemolyticus]|nr:hypothetical protein ACX02_02750 [Vibrio parahaemolyticus]KZW08644.1 hypothetical protein APF56_22665 [Vibrio parahaemolyticus]KZW09121.1 hypothetical protein APF57_22290 [Vibrio parahaemolyticus]KZW09514.1 hypothetical protein APF58_22530 [Vibrio parahaemolyticus]KZW22914.1 hypothetical protein APF61_13050 [Vibrio parahaemolyticus]
MILGQKYFIVIFATGCCKIGVGVCPTACWTFDEAGNFLIVQQLVAQINLMLVSCALNTSWGNYESISTAIFLLLIILI